MDSTGLNTNAHLIFRFLLNHFLSILPLSTTLWFFLNKTTVKSIETQSCTLLQNTLLVKNSFKLLKVWLSFGGKIGNDFFSRLSLTVRTTWWNGRAPAWWKTSTSFITCGRFLQWVCLAAWTFVILCVCVHVLARLQFCLFSHVMRQLGASLQRACVC